MQTALRYLCGSPLTDDPLDLDQLFQSVLERRTIILVGSVFICFFAIIIAYLTSSFWPLLWLAAEIVLTAARWSLMKAAMRHEGARRLALKYRICTLSITWSVVFGLAVFWCMTTGDIDLIVFACLLATTATAVITSRNAATPRIATICIVAIGAPFLLGLMLSPIRSAWVGALVSLPWLGSLYLFTLQNHTGLVRLIVAERKASRLAHTDELTGLYNRTFFRKHREALFPRAAEDAYGYLCVDLDDFKQVNDRYGHAAGDDVLREAAERMSANIRKHDLIFRIGGDEFVVYLPGVDALDCARVATRFLEQFARPFHLSGGETIPVTASIGSACLGEASVEPRQLLKLADGALYSAKAAGRGLHIHSAR